jgi:4'-phosphopantetheinyl transferase
MSTGEGPWTIPPRQVLLEPGSLHIWRAPLVPAAVRGHLLEALPASEREEGSRFVRPADRTQWMLARASLRMVLAKYLGGDPRELRIEVGASGKPGLAQAPDSPIRFNLSHSDNLALIAVSQGREVGIDVERIREVPKLKAILDDFFSEQEQAYVLSREGQVRTTAFFLLWTRREAAAKAVGIGLFEALTRFTLPLRDVDRAGFRVDLPRPLAISGGSIAWWLRDISPAPGFAGAVCTEAANPEPSLYILHT